MTEERVFLAAARRRYAEVNRATLEWMLARPRLNGVFLNTKRNSITLRDYDRGDGWRAPDIIYGWIQGRGLEALMAHADFFESAAPELAAKLRNWARDLYQALAALQARDGHAYFAYDAALDPIHPDESGARAPQAKARDLYTYSDIFVAKGLIAASTRFAPEATKDHLMFLAEIVRAIEENRFVMEEKQRLAPEALAGQADEYGPRMIMLGAAALLRRLGFEAESAFAPRFIAHAIAHHLIRDESAAARGALRDARNGDRINPGHAIEFVGLALDYDPKPPQLDTLREILTASFKIGFAAPGLRLSARVDTGEPLSGYFPWWPLPEAMRAAALLYKATGDAAALAIWRRVHDAFFAHYWRDGASLAYQTRDEQSPVDYVPATPDLDPGYHTGLSFLTAIETIDALPAGGR